MPVYNCPLCKQTVTRKLYEEITGIWKEREKQLQALKTKEKALEKKVKDAKLKFDKEKVKIQKSFDANLKQELKKQQAGFKKEILAEKKKLEETKKKIEESYTKKLATATKKAVLEEKKKQKEQLKILQDKLKKDASDRLSKEKIKLEKDKKKLEREQKLQKDRNVKLLKQYQSLQTKSEKQLQSANKKITSLEEQLKKNQTPQMLGLLEEKVFLEKLKAEFPQDEFDHTGKGGDIVHYIKGKDANIGIIVYELKKVATFSSKHILQARKAKETREADYGILITNAKRSKKDTGFSMEKGVIIIHPAGALVLISILRDNIINIAKLKLSKTEREKTIKAVLEYIQGPVFANSIEGIIQDSIDLHTSLTKEVTDHIKNWEFRFEKYKRINTSANKIDSKVVRLLLEDEKRKKGFVGKQSITPILLPEKID